MAVHRAGISTKTMHFDHVSARSCLLGQNSWECWCFSIGFWIHMLVSKSAINVDCKKIFKSCSTLVSKSARNVGYEKIFKSCWPAAALGLSIINVTFRVLRRLEFAADISGTCAQSRELINLLAGSIQLSCKVWNFFCLSCCEVVWNPFTGWLTSKSVCRNQVR